MTKTKFQKLMSVCTFPKPGTEGYYILVVGASLGIAGLWFDNPDDKHFLQAFNTVASYLVLSGVGIFIGLCVMAHFYRKKRTSKF